MLPVLGVWRGLFSEFYGICWQEEGMQRILYLFKCSCYISHSFTLNFFLLLLMLSNRTLCRESVKLTPPITSVAGVLNERGKGELKYTRTQGVPVDSLHVCMNSLHRRHVKGRGEILLTHPLCSCSPKFSLPPSRDLMPVAITIH